jgi:hypothetical protein
MLACAIAALTLAHPALTGGFLVNPHSDQFIAGYAFREYAADVLRTQGHFPLWNPYLLGGLPYVDAMHGDIFYPTFLLRMVLPTDVAMTWGMILHFWLAGVAGYALMRAHKLSFAASLVGGLAYMMSGMIAGLVSPGHDGKLFITALFPLTMLVLRFGIRGGRSWAWGVLAVIVGLAVLSPHPQLLQYLLLCSGAYALWLSFWEGGEGAPLRPVAVKRLVTSLGAIALGFAIGAIQYVPVMNYVKWSPRAGGAGWDHAISYSMPPEEWINSFLPQFSGILDNYWGRNGIHFHSDYIGVSVLLLAAAAFGGDVLRKRTRWFWTGLLVVTAFWAMGGYTPFYHLVWWVPGTKFFRAPSTMMFASSFAIAALAALGTTRVLAGEVGKRFFIAAAATVGFITLLGVSGGLYSIASGGLDEGHFAALDANRGALAAGAVRMCVFGLATLALMFAVNARNMSARIGAWALAAVVVADLWSIERYYWMFSPPAAETFASDAIIERIKKDPEPGRVLALELPRPMSRDPYMNYDGLMVHGIRIAEGYQGNSLVRYDSLRYPPGPGLTSQTFFALANVQWVYTNADSLNERQLEHVLGPVRNSFGSMINLYRLKGDNPFAWVVTAIMKVPDDVSLATLATPGYPVRSVALFDTSASVTGEKLTAAPPPLSIHAKTTHYEPGLINIELDAPAPAKSALMVSENFYPGWNVTIDGQPATASRADYTFIGVPLIAGARKIELRFTSDAFEKGKRITLVALVIAMALAVGGLVLDRRSASA